MTSGNASAPRSKLARAFRVAILAFGVLGAHPAWAAGGAVIYTYDALGRVTTASYDTGVIIIYTYDSNGNRTQKVVKVNTSTLIWSPAVTPCTATCWGTNVW
jgi:YD repeat-containing protein